MRAPRCRYCRTPLCSDEQVLHRLSAAESGAVAGWEIAAMYLLTRAFHLCMGCEGRFVGALAARLLFAGGAA